MAGVRDAEEREARCKNALARPAVHEQVSVEHRGLAGRNNKNPAEAGSVYSRAPLRVRQPHGDATEPVLDCIDIGLTIPQSMLLRADKSDPATGRRRSLPRVIRSAAPRGHGDQTPKRCSIMLPIARHALALMAAINSA